MRHTRQQPMLTASEVGEYVFCAKAWKLKREGVLPKSPRLKAGTAYHQAHQAGLHWSQRLRQLGLAIILLALAAALLSLTGKVKLWP
jgi:hypothetical protein